VAGIVAPLQPALAARGTSSAARRVTLPGSVPAGLPASSSGTALAPDQAVQVSLHVAHPDKAGEDALFNAVYNPHSPLYHHFLTPAQYAARFGVSEVQAHGVQSFLTGGGLKVSYQSAAHTMWLATGTAAQVDKLFGVTLRSYTAGSTTY